ncbi:MAG: hypothetical protein LBV02_09195 [Bacteroidales bacterium]|jgi:hypothetical protein|nr:hypothetical protein [Bacteroidales bacterium]
MKTESKKVTRQKNAPKKQNSFVDTWQRITSNKITTFLLLFIIVINFSANYSAIFDRKLNLNGDNMTYFSLGKALSEGKGYTNTMGFTESPHTHFPPGYSVFLAGFMKIFPDNIIAAKLLNGFLLLGTAVVLFFLIRKITKNAVLALCVALLSCMQINVLDFATMMMSEILFMITTTLAIYLAILLNERSLFLDKRVMNYVVVFLLFFCAIYCYFIRTVGTALILSLILWFGFFGMQTLWNWLKTKKERKEDNEKQYVDYPHKFWFIQRMAICAFMAVFFLIANHLWSERNSAAGKKSGMYVSEFTKKGGGEVMETLDDWTTRIKNNLMNFTTKWIPGVLFNISYDDTAPTAKQWIIGCLTALMLLIGLTGLGQAGLLLFFYVGGTLAVLLFFPEQFQGSRYLIAIIPYLIFLFINGLCRIIFYIGKLAIPKTNTFLIQTVVVLLVSLFYLAPTYVKSQENSREIAKFTSWKKMNNPPMNNYLEAVEWCAKNLPDTVRVICRKPEIYYMFSGFKSAGGFPQYAEVDTVYNGLLKQNATHLIIDSWFRHAYVTLYPVIQKYPEKFKFLHQIGTIDEVNGLNPTLIFQFNPEWGYVGDRVDGKKEGKGEELFNDGRKYIGEYSNNLPNGYGELYDASGNPVMKGIWKDGGLVTPH